MLCEYGHGRCTAPDTKCPHWIETREDLEGCCFKSGCMYGLEKTEPTEEELAEFDKWANKWNGVQV